MDIDPRTYPSRTFVRFTAHNQLKADATGQTITASVQRLGGKSYVQQAIPDGEFPSIISGSSGFKMGMSVSPIGDESITDGDIGNSQAADPLGDAASLSCDNEAQMCGVDETLFEEIIKTTITPNRFPDLYQCCGTQKAAMEVEAIVAAEVVASYRQIKQKQDCPIVQRLNNLL